MPINSRRMKTVAWILTGLFVAVNLVSYHFNLYRNEKIVWWDEAMHCVTTFAFTLLLVSYLYDRTIMGAHTHPLLFVLTVLFVGLALGGLWEVYEFVHEQMTPRDTILGYWDTVVDLLMDALGAGVAGIVTVVTARRH